MIKVLLKQKQYDRVFDLTKKLPLVYINFESAQKFQVQALEKYGKNKFSGLVETLVGHNKINIDEAMELMAELVENY